MENCPETLCETKKQQKKDQKLKEGKTQHGQSLAVIKAAAVCEDVNHKE